MAEQAPKTDTKPARKPRVQVSVELTEQEQAKLKTIRHRLEHDKLSDTYAQAIREFIHNHQA